MPVKIRLQRRGRKFAKIYSIVVADGRAPRDGRYIETLGQYNPNTNPATIKLDFDKSLEWLQKGAQPTDTCRAILSYKGVMYKKHLLEGVKKGAFDEAEAEKRFQTWLSDKEGKIQAKIDKLSSDKDSVKQDRMAVETKIMEARAAEIVKQRSKLLEAEAAAESGEEVVAEEAPAAEEVKEEETPVAEEKPAEEVKKEEAPVEKAKAEETPAVEEKKAPVEEAKSEEAKVEEKPVAEEKKAEEVPAKEVKAEEPKADDKPADDKSEADKKEE